MKLLIPRLVLLATLSIFAMQGAWRDLAFYGSVFVVTLPLTHPRLRQADAAINGLFAAAAILAFTNVALTQSVLGLDKIFHALGGAAAALIIHAVLKTKLPREWWLRALIITAGAVAIGAWWEVFEWAFFSLIDPSALTAITYTDTMIDLVADTIGAAIAAVALARTTSP